MIQTMIEQQRTIIIIILINVTVAFVIFPINDCRISYIKVVK